MNEVEVIHVDPLGVELSRSTVMVADPDPELAKVFKLKTLANRRWEACQFFVYDGVKAPADSAMTAITATAVAVNLGLRDPQEIIIWKLADGEFRQWLLPDLLAYANAVQGHIQNCFNHEALLSGLIQSADTAADVDAINIEAGWPS
jgi:hypothetical protein